jgi:superfamily II DNA or RNA helicase
MSITIHLDDLTSEQRNRIAKELRFAPVEKQTFFKGGNKFAKPIKKYVEPYDVTEQDIVYLPYNWAITNFSIQRPSDDTFRHITGEFSGTLRNIQKEIKKECIPYLNDTGSIVIAAYPGAGKTGFGVYMTVKCGLRCAVIAHRIPLLNQWKESFNRFAPGLKVQILDSTSDLNDESDVVIMNAQNVPKFGRIFNDFGLVLVDEIHLIVTESLIKSMLYFKPKYLIGLSATPYRSDGMDALIDVYFGKAKIVKKLCRPHIYYKINTGLEPEYEVDDKGDKIWGSVLNWQADCEERNDMILKVIGHFRDKHFLILCKRKTQAKYLEKKLKERGERVDVIIESKNEFDKEARVLIATLQKCGVGFSHDILDALIVAGDMEEYFEQYLGRVMRREDVKPLIFDFVDEMPALKRHFNTRKKVSEESGGIIKNYDISII